MIVNNAIKNYLNINRKSYILKSKPLQYKISPKELGVIFADQKIKFQNEETISKYITARLVDSLNRPKSKQFERVIVKKELTILGEGNGEQHDCTEALRNIIGPFVKRKNQNIPMDLEVFHSHPDSSFCKGTSPLSDPEGGDLFSFFSLKLKKIVAINSKGEFNSMEINDNFSVKNFKRFQKDFIKYYDQELYNGLITKGRKLSKVIRVFYNLTGNSKLVKWLTKKLDKISEEIQNIHQKKYKNTDKIFIVYHKFYQRAEDYGMKYSTNFSNLVM